MQLKSAFLLEQFPVENILVCNFLCGEFHAANVVFEILIAIQAIQ